MLDSEIRKTGLSGNFCCLVLEIEGVPNAKYIDHCLDSFNHLYPSVTSRLKQSGRRFQWHYSKLTKIPFYTHNCGAQPQLATKFINEIINKSTTLNESAPIEFHLISWVSNSLLLLRWYHPICDAKGAELILHHLFVNHSTVKNDNLNPIAEQIKRFGFWQNFKYCLQSKRNIQKLDQHISILPTLKTQTPDFLKSKISRFDEIQSKQIIKFAIKYTGITGISLYFIGCMMRALESTGNLEPGEAYCVPYAVNLRKRKSLSPILSNQVTFVFAQAERKLLNSRSTLFGHLREQNKDTIKQSLDKAMLPLMQAGSWLSLDKYGEIVRNTSTGNERSSFWFSYTGAMEPTIDHIDGCKVNDMYQLSQVTSPPSLGLLVNSFQNRITLSYNYVNNQFSATWIDELLQNMRNELLEFDAN